MSNDWGRGKPWRAFEESVLREIILACPSDPYEAEPYGYEHSTTSGLRYAIRQSGGRGVQHQPDGITWRREVAICWDAKHSTTYPDSASVEEECFGHQAFLKTRVGLDSIFVGPGFRVFTAEDLAKQRLRPGMPGKKPFRVMPLRNQPTIRELFGVPHVDVRDLLWPPGYEQGMML